MYITQDTPAKQTAGKKVKRVLDYEDSSVCL